MAATAENTRRNFIAARALTKTSAPVGPEQDSDVQLMLSVQRGDMAAFRQLFDKHIAGVVGFAAQFVGVRARAEELAQDVFLQLYRARSRYVPRARFKTWLYRMVTNACLSELRRPDYQSQWPHAVEPDRSSDLQNPQLADRSSEEAALSRESVERLHQALAELPPNQRAAILLARGEGLTYEEVANALSCSVSAVKSLVHRATVTLRQRMHDDEE